MPSITTWMRLEPRSRTAEMATSLQARVYDPLWLLARQWQLGEFQGEDNGSPVLARWRAESARLTRYRPSALGSEDGGADAYDPARTPLETLVECETVRPPHDHDGKPERLRLAAEAGQHFLRLLDAQPLSRSYRDVFTGRFAFPPLSKEEQEALDPGSLSYLQIVGPRVPDGRRLYTALRPQPGAKVKLPAGLGILPADVAEVEKAAENWLKWYETLFDEPGADRPAWSAERMEYAFSVSARLGNGEQVLTAAEFSEGRVDWYAFDLDPGKTLGAPDGARTEVTKTAIPAPVSFRGMPAPRFWEFEDARVDLAAVDAGPADLARMLLVEFALTYGNDWFVLPVDLEVGTVCWTRSLVITDTFGVRTLVQPAGAQAAAGQAWRLFQLAQVHESQRREPVANLFFLPPALMQALESRPVEEVLFLRDEMANLAWAVERLIENAAEGPLNRFEAYLERERRGGEDPGRDEEAPVEGTTAPGTLRYRLTTEVPDYWVPLMPVRTEGGLRLRRGAVLKTDGSKEVVRAKGRILESGRALSLFEEEVPREGVRVVRSYQHTRWIDGSSHLWIGRRKGAGRGEGSSGLRFDRLENETPSSA